MNAETQVELVESLSLELRRGLVVLAVLVQLGQEEYGYSLKRSLAEAGLPVDEGTLYPLLRRLEAQGLLSSRWRLEEGRPRRYYRISAKGGSVLKAVAAEWKTLAATMERLLP